MPGSPTKYSGAVYWKRREVSSNNGARDDAIVALALLEAEGTIVGYLTNFRRLGEPGVSPEVVITIVDEDELAIPRSSRRVLNPFIAGSTTGSLPLSCHPSRSIAAFVHCPISATCSVVTRNSTRVLGPNVSVRGTSAASRPREIKILPIRGSLLRGSNVCQLPPK